MTIHQLFVVPGRHQRLFQTVPLLGDQRHGVLPHLLLQLEHRQPGCTVLLLMIRGLDNELIDIWAKKLFHMLAPVVSAKAQSSSSVWEL